MSEPIQSISNGNYILHNIDAKKLYVQEPLFTANSGDAVYVGWRPDETVLWSGDATSGTFTEDISGFDRLKVLYVWNAATDNKAKYAELQAIPQVFSYLENGKAGNTYNWFGWGSWNIASTGFNLLNAYQSIANLTATTPVASGPKMYKVIGINRKENA